MYHQGSRRLQDRFDTRRLADRLEERKVSEVIAPDDAAFIEAADMFFIATADEHGRPNCSYKGGDPGFVRVLDERTIAFPNYDGNGMYLSLGNALVNPEVGLLFISFERQRRLRLNGTASVDDELAGGLGGRAVRGAGAGARGVPQLPALHPPLRARRALALRPASRGGAARAGLEAARLGARRPARRRSRRRGLTGNRRGYRRSMRRAAIVIGLLVLPAIAAPAAMAHPERQAFFPDGNVGSVPKFRNTASQILTVCKSDSKQRIREIFRGSKELRRERRWRVRLLKRCRFEHIQEAVNAARNDAMIRVMPGVYREEPSRAAPEPDPNCAGDYDEIGGGLESGITGEGGSRVANYEYQRKCPNAQNLIAIIGDSPDPDRVCDSKCNIQILGMGRRRGDVLISGQRSKLNVIRADRADGIYIKRLTVEHSDFNNVYVLETNGFRIEDVESRYSREYGVLTFTSDHGLYNRVEAYGSGDSGIYPGSGPEGHCARYGIEIRNSDSHHNTIGYSGTAGNGVWAHDNRFHHNATGMTTDSFASGHPGMPQDCAKCENNEIYSNNEDYFNDERDAYCRNTPSPQRDPKIVCPTFQVPVGTGIGIFGGNGDIVRDNWIYDNWRDGVKLLYVPANFRGEPDKGIDTSFDNTFERNRMGVRPDGTRDPNGERLLVGRGGQGQLLERQRGPEGLRAVEQRACSGCPGAPARRSSRRAARTRPPARPRARPGTPTRTRTRRAATGSRARLSRSEERLAVLIAAAAALSGCGGGDSEVKAGDGSGPLRWAEAPLLFTPETLPGDRILTGTLRNDSTRRVRVDLPDVRVLADDGSRVPAAPVFLRTFGKTLWSPGRGPSQMPETELLRTGRIAFLRPGDEVPFTVAWHAEDGEPAVVDYGPGSLPVPG